LSPGVERFTGPETSGFVPVSEHGCGNLCSVLRRGKGEGLVGCVLSFSKVFSTIDRDPYVIFLFYGVLCLNLVLPLLN
jgi:hypothetical protein